jgi:transposase-like protein
VTNTALANSLRKDMVDAFLPWLSQQRPIAHAAEAFGATEQTIKGLVERFRIWLLRLDPSGKYERRVKLGLKVTWPVMHCPKCDQDAPARPHGFARRKSVPAGKLRLFRCTACEGFITVPIENLPGPGTA